jgi:serine/threonine protein kinase
MEDPLTDYTGSRWYRAPEQLLGSPQYGTSVDTWALGCVLGEMISGNPVFAGNSTGNQVSAELYHTSRMLCYVVYICYVANIMFCYVAYGMLCRTYMLCCACYVMSYILQNTMCRVYKLQGNLELGLCWRKDRCRASINTSLELLFPCVVTDDIAGDIACRLTGLS